MKIANSEVIKKREQELIGAIAENLDWEAIRQVLRDKHGLSIGEDVIYRRAGIDAKENKILYSIDFDVNITLSIRLDRDGELVGVKSSRSEDLGAENVEEGGRQESQIDPVGSSDIEMDDLGKTDVVEKEFPGKLEDEAAPDESEGGYEDVLMEFGSDSSGKVDQS
jgi:hypothetical protein